jgi:hypothetical protein
VAKLKEYANHKGGQLENVALINMTEYTVEQDVERTPSYYRALATIGGGYKLEEDIARTTVDAPGTSVVGKLQTRVPLDDAEHVVQKYLAEDGEWRRVSFNESLWGSWRQIIDTSISIFDTINDAGIITADAQAELTAGNLIRDPTFLSVGASSDDTYWRNITGTSVLLTSGAVTNLGVNRGIQGAPGDGTMAWAGSMFQVNHNRHMLVEPNTNYKFKLKVYYPTGFVGQMRVVITSVPASGSTSTLATFTGTDYRTSALGAAAVAEVTGKFKIPAGSLLTPAPKEIWISIDHLPSTTLNNPTNLPWVWARPSIMPIIKTTDILRTDDTTAIVETDFMSSTPPTGWVAATGTKSRATFATGSATTGDVAQRLAQLIDDLLTRGVIGA